LPPVINCRTAEDIFERVVEFIRDPDKLDKMGEESRQWISEHHAKGDTVNLQVTQFKQLLESPLYYQQNQDRL
jgi:hypothetical protein